MGSNWFVALAGFLLIFNSAEALVTIDVHDAKDLLDSGAYWYVDARTKEEFKEGYVDVKKIVNIPYMFKTPEGNFTKNPLFVKHVSSIFKNDCPLIVGCLSGSRSLHAATALENSGFKNVTNMGGGYSAWVKSGYPVKKP
ncbi:thiosulfate sulfurtransferase 18-like [Macadamia integrifolia]|uniref:thiosulfate sulfurtransferase 18-like n=1 Tax=Macadamia integrifolia TaxID=60698 RepID=UPI001C4ED27C|nr:thiosulfate sulfurtransferase 18-like [Macadamia integrifolia]